MNDIEWKDFQIGGEDGVFSIKSSISQIDKKNLNIEIGNVPYVTRTDLNNGIAMYVTRNQDKQYTTNKGNVISIGLDTQTIFYQPNEFYTGQNIQILSHEELNEHIARFLIPLLETQLEKFSWGGNGATLKRLNNSRVMLPVNKRKEPDWKYMEKVGKELYQSSNRYIKDYVINKLELLQKEFSNENKVDFMTKDWLAFNLLDFFEPKRGNQNNMASLVEGNTPLVSARKFENGYKDFVTSTEKPLYEGNIITLNNDGDGGAGIAYYQPCKMALDTHVTALYPKFQLNKYQLLFITRTITHQRAKFGNNYPINNLRLKALKIMLPINDNKEPDWNFMEKYMKHIEYERLTNLTEYLD